MKEGGNEPELYPRCAYVKYGPDNYRFIETVV